MSPDGTIHRIETEAHKKALEKEHGKLLELEEEAAEKLQALPKAIRQAFYKAMMPNAKDRSYNKPKFNKAEVRKKNKLARAARRRNRK